VSTIYKLNLINQLLTITGLTRGRGAGEPHRLTPDLKLTVFVAELRQNTR